MTGRRLRTQPLESWRRADRMLARIRWIVSRQNPHLSRFQTIANLTLERYTTTRSKLGILRLASVTHVGNTYRVRAIQFGLALCLMWVSWQVATHPRVRPPEIL